MSSIKNISQLREQALNAIELLSKGEIDVNQASTIGNLCEDVVMTIKSELEYARMIGQEPNIEFMKYNKVDKIQIEKDDVKSLPHLHKK